MIRKSEVTDKTPRLPFDHDAPPIAEEGDAYAVAGLFAGIGGLELGLQRAGHVTKLLCELDPYAKAVLHSKFHTETGEIASDVRTLDTLPDVDLVTAGFPCQDLSQAGRTKGIRGERSGLVDEVFRLVSQAEPRWVLLENVPFMLSLERGRAMTHLVERFTDLGFRWAYRVVDTRAFGLPQRRRRVMFLASRTHDPRQVLLSDDAGQPHQELDESREDIAYGFYWTEGTRGLGWAVDAVPTLKGGSTIGIPSPPAIWTPDGRIVTPHINDAERLQGFPLNWTRAAMKVAGSRQGTRWKLVGNAVSVPVAKWIGSRLLRPAAYDAGDDLRLDHGSWPSAAWNMGGATFEASVSEWPKRYKRKPLLEFLRHPLKPLSERASRGFHRRASAGYLRFKPGFLDAVEHHADTIALSSENDDS